MNDESKMRLRIHYFCHRQRMLTPNWLRYSTTVALFRNKLVSPRFRQMKAYLNYPSHTHISVFISWWKLLISWKWFPRIMMVISLSAAIAYYICACDCTLYVCWFYCGNKDGDDDDDIDFFAIFTRVGTGVLWDRRVAFQEPSGNIFPPIRSIFLWIFSSNKGSIHEQNSAPATD
jgi:hypothetical protein